MCLELVDCLVIRGGSFSVMLASSGLVLFRRNQVAVLVALSYYICREIIEGYMRLERRRGTSFLVWCYIVPSRFLVVVFY